MNLFGGERFLVVRAFQLYDRWQRDAIKQDLLPLLYQAISDRLENWEMVYPSYKKGEDEISVGLRYATQEEPEEILPEDWEEVAEYNNNRDDEGTMYWTDKYGFHWKSEENQDNDAFLTLSLTDSGWEISPSYDAEKVLRSKETIFPSLDAALREIGRVSERGFDEHLAYDHKEWLEGVDEKAEREGREEGEEPYNPYEHGQIDFGWFKRMKKKAR